MELRGKCVVKWAWRCGNKTGAWLFFEMYFRTCGDFFVKKSFGKKSEVTPIFINCLLCRVWFSVFWVGLWM